MISSSSQMDRLGLGHNTFSEEALSLILRSADGVIRAAGNLTPEMVNTVLIEPHRREGVSSCPPVSHSQSLIQRPPAHNRCFPDLTYQWFRKVPITTATWKSTDFTISIRTVTSGLKNERTFLFVFKEPTILIPWK